MVDFTVIPLVSLSSHSKELLSALLNPHKVIPTYNGLPRDWRGLADLFQVGGEMIPSIASQPDPTGHILDTVSKKNPECTLKDLQLILEKIDRWDVIDDVQFLFEKDAQNYLTRLEKCQDSANGLISNVDNQMLTIDDLYRVRAGLSTQLYDAFLLYADEDSSFADEMITILENEYKLKLCVKDRDLISGVSFEHGVLMELISERCNRLLVIFSPNFLKSPVNEFLLNYAQAVSIERGQKKIIPCIYQWCKLPPQLAHYTVLDYTRSTPHYNFWKRLQCSIETVDPQSILQRRETQQNAENVPEHLPASETSSETNSSPLKTSNAVSQFNGETRSPKKKKSMLFSWTTKKWSPKSQEDRENQSSSVKDDSIVTFPSLEGLDSLESSSISVEDSPKKEKKPKNIRTYAKKLKSFIVKS